MTPVVVVGGGLTLSHSVKSLTIANVFRILSVVATLSVPVARAFTNIPAFFGSLLCLTRIQKFLLLADVTVASKKDEEAKSKLPDRKGKTPERRKRLVYLAVELDNVSITLPGHDAPLLRNIKLSVRQGQTAMIYGPVGCGKSSLLRALLGELEMTGGFAGVDRRKIAYCDQTPWLQNHSIRDNIISQNEFNRAWYTTVLHACALNEDLAQLPSGDETLVGTSGGALSGGQKQRVVSFRTTITVTHLHR